MSDRMSFEAWISELETIMSEWGAEYGGRPYGDGSLTETTGLECWRDFYDDGFSPLEAFEEDRDNWE